MKYFSNSDIKEIFKRRARGDTFKSIARKFGVSDHTIQKVVTLQHACTQGRDLQLEPLLVEKAQSIGKAAPRKRSKNTTEPTVAELVAKYIEGRRMADEAMRQLKKRQSANDSANMLVDLAAELGGGASEGGQND